MTPENRKVEGQSEKLRREHEARMDAIIAEHQVGCDRRAKVGTGLTVKQLEPDWCGECEICGASPIVPATGMCGPCTFGEAETVNGNW